MSTREERTQQAAERAARRLDEMRAGVWPHALASAVLKIAVRDGAISEPALLAELEAATDGSSTLDVSDGVKIPVGGRASAEAIERLRQALTAGTQDRLD